MSEKLSYDPTWFAPLAATEDRHFWFRARNQVIGALTRQVTRDLATGYRVLDVGCGTGNVLRVLEKACPSGAVVGMDLFGEGLAFARRRTNCGLVRGDVARPPFRTTFEVIGLFDVLEHLSDDLQALCDIHALLAPGGVLMLTVPAHQSLWSYFDEASRHQRRYEPEELERKLGQTGYKIEYLTQYMASIFPLVWLGRRLAALFGQRNEDLATKELRITPVVNEVLASLLFWEAAFVARRRSLPLGCSLLALACKP